MAVRRLAEEQPQSFQFTPENLAWAEHKIADYPQGRQSSAVIPVLWRAQEQHNGWLPEPAIRVVADMLDMPYIRVFEIATFYTMFQLQPIGSVAHIGVCGTTPCMLRGAEDLVAICKERIASQPFTLSADGKFSWEEVECAGACVNAPMVQIGPETFEDLTPESFAALLDALAAGGTPTPGPQSGRRASEPLSGLTSLNTAQTHEAPAAPAAELETKSADVDPATPAARNENAARPDSSAKPGAEAARSTSKPAPSDAPQDDASARADGAGTRPAAMTRNDVETPDKLQQISGIGPVIEKKLHELGIFTFRQIATWDQPNKDWVSSYLAFKGRIDRERWVEQAQIIVNETRDES
ncbi:MAG: NADH-quinone oxidoreductase subunit NuoE [Pseudomonadota bacterium]